MAVACSKHVHGALAVAARRRALLKSVLSVAPGRVCANAAVRRAPAVAVNVILAQRMRQRACFRRVRHNIGNQTNARHSGSVRKADTADAIVPTRNNLASDARTMFVIIITGLGIAVPTVEII